LIKEGFEYIELAEAGQNVFKEVIQVASSSVRVDRAESFSVDNAVLRD
jgi:hypothetical protein